MKSRIYLLFLLFSALSAFADVSAAQTTAPESLALEIKEAAEVRRDGRGIPYIEAKSEADLYFVQGFETARDRLWQMDLLRRVSGGRTAEIFGQRTLEEDKRWRKFGFRGIAEESIRYLSPELKAALGNYARGVNAYISSLNETTMPVEFKILQYRPEPWTPADTVLIGKILSDALSTTYRRDLVRASISGIEPAKLAELEDPVTPFDVVLFGNDRPRTANRTRAKLAVDHLILAAAERDAELRERSLSLLGVNAEELAASNNWVIAGKRTKDGRALLANDPHLMPAAPGIWYLVHLSAPGMRVAGVTFPGVPGVVLGHNEHIAWGATNVGPDVQDVYFENIKDGKAATPDGPKEVTIRNEEIKFRENPLSPALSSTTLSVTETRNGPVILEEGEKRYALKWTALDPKNNEFQSFYYLNRAKTWDEFKKAISTYSGATQNFIYADTKGNIGWYAAGKIPIRRTGDGALPYDGSTNAGDWTGYIPFAELPNLYNPAEGFILTANQRIVGTDYKYQQISRDAAPPWRARRIYDRLKEADAGTIAGSESIQRDAFNMPLSMLARDIVRLGGASNENLALYREWDGFMTPDSRAALMTNQVRGCLADRIAAENQPVPSAMIRERILWHAVGGGSKLWLPKEFASWKDFLIACDSAAEAELAKRLGTDRSKWTWGSAFTARFPHPLAAAPLIGAQFATPSIGIPGSGQSPNVGSGVSMRHVSSAGNWDATQFVIPLGQSGDPRSPHYKDQFEMWNGSGKAVFPFTDAAVRAAAKTTVTYRPKAN